MTSVTENGVQKETAEDEVAVHRTAAGTTSKTSNGSANDNGGHSANHDENEGSETMGVANVAMNAAASLSDRLPPQEDSASAADGLHAGPTNESVAPPQASVRASNFSELGTTKPPSSPFPGAAAATPPLVNVGTASPQGVSGAASAAAGHATIAAPATPFTNSPESQRKTRSSTRKRKNPPSPPHLSSSNAALLGNESWQDLPRLSVTRVPQEKPTGVLSSQDENQWPRWHTTRQPTGDQVLGSTSRSRTGWYDLQPATSPLFGIWAQSRRIHKEVSKKPVASNLALGGHDGGHPYDVVLRVPLGSVRFANVRKFQGNFCFVAKPDECAVVRGQPPQRFDVVIAIDGNLVDALQPTTLDSLLLARTDVPERTFTFRRHDELACALPKNPAAALDCLVACDNDDDLDEKEYHQSLASFINNDDTAEFSSDDDSFQREVKAKKRSSPVKGASRSWDDQSKGDDDSDFVEEDNVEDTSHLKVTKAAGAAASRSTIQPSGNQAVTLPSNHSFPVQNGTYPMPPTASAANHPSFQGAGNMSWQLQLLHLQRQQILQRYQALSSGGASASATSRSDGPSVDPPVTNKNSSSRRRRRHTHAALVKGSYQMTVPVQNGRLYLSVKPKDGWVVVSRSLSRSQDSRPARESIRNPGNDAIIEIDGFPVGDWTTGKVVKALKNNSGFTSRTLTLAPLSSLIPIDTV